MMNSTNNRLADVNSTVQIEPISDAFASTIKAFLPIINQSPLWKLVLDLHHPNVLQFNLHRAQTLFTSLYNTIQLFNLKDCVSLVVLLLLCIEGSTKQHTVQIFSLIKARLLVDWIVCQLYPLIHVAHRSRLVRNITSLQRLASNELLISLLYISLRTCYCHTTRFRGEHEQNFIKTTA